MNLLKIAKPGKLDMGVVKSVLSSIEDEAVRVKAAKIVQWDTQDKSGWLLSIADPYCPVAADADPDSVASVLTRCGYDAQTAAMRSAKRFDSSMYDRQYREKRAAQ